MIYCVNEPGWCIFLEEGKTIRLDVGDKLYTYDNNFIHLLQRSNGWFWSNKDDFSVTRFLSSNHTKNSRYYIQDISYLSGLSVISDITKSVDRDIRLKSLGI